MEEEEGFDAEESKPDVASGRAEGRRPIGAPRNPSARAQASTWSGSWDRSRTPRISRNWGRYADGSRRP
eukprot:1136955-Amphidinium_carterae.1